MPASLSAIPGLSRGHWRDTSPTLPSGHDALDAQLPGGGWPLGAVSEILSDGRPGEGLGLLLPSLAHLTQAGRWVALLDPPWRPYAPALAHAGLDLRHVIVVRSPAPRTALWTCEQLLRDLAGGAVLAWPLESPGFGPLRRLQLAAAGGRQAGFLFRPAGAARSPSPAALRLQLEAREGRLRATVLKCRGFSGRGRHVSIRDSRLPGEAGLFQRPMSFSTGPGNDDVLDRHRMPTPAARSARARPS